MRIDPLATYRLQLGPQLDFDAVVDSVDYLADLGVSHLYLSPILQAAPGSTHGYDVADPARMSDALGGEEGFRRLCAAAHDAGLGIVVDIVPNHMAADAANPWWWDLLRQGREGEHGRFFDVEWEPPEPRHRGKVLLPILGDHYGRVLESGELQVVPHQGATFALRYHDYLLPLSPASVIQLESVDLDVVNADPDRLDDLVGAQHYRLALWRAARRDLTYRRFFDIDALAALRVEDEEVFAAAHELVLRWHAEGCVDGLRIDHIDGLRRPGDYLSRLRTAAPDAWIVVEKILEGDETLPPSWSADGTTGYEFLNQALGLFIDAGNEAAFDDIARDMIGVDTSWPEIVDAAKYSILDQLLGSDVARLTQLLVDICEQRRRYRDFTRHELHEAVKALLVAFPVYRTYVDADAGTIEPTDIAVIERALSRAAAQRRDLDPDLWELLGSLLTLKLTGPLETELVARFQQTSGPVMAKGVEDTAFYRYQRFVALNEVGGDPARFGVSVAAFHEANAHAAAHHPLRMVTLSTHDTKRSEDVRARLAVLSERPVAWRHALDEWRERHAAADRRVDPAAAYLFHQTIVGAWPIDAPRLERYMLKAVREAKLVTSWREPNPAYEEKLRRFVAAALSDTSFTASVADFVAALEPAATNNALGQKLLSLTVPGVPDLYQGAEIWHHRLVDPDNRQPVDFADLVRRLDAVKAGGTPQPAAAAAKLHLVATALDVRRSHPEAFGPHGAYVPLSVAGKHADRIVAYQRGDRIAVIVPRLTSSVDAWSDTHVDLPGGRWDNVLTAASTPGGVVAMAELIADFPVALLVRAGA